MKKNILKIGLLSLLFSSFGIHAQELQEKKGAQQVERYAYVDAIKIYERVAKKGYESVEMYKNLGDSYYFNGKLTEANQWYEKMFGLFENPNYITAAAEKTSLPSEYYYRYGQTLKAVGNYQKSDAVLKTFEQKELGDSRGRLAKSEQDYLAEIKANSGRYNINSLTINSGYSDYGSTMFNNQLIFTSARDTGNLVKKTHTWTGDSFTSLYAATLDEEGTPGTPKRFAKEIKTKFNESTPVFSADGQTMYFTRNNFNKGKRGKDAHKTTLLKIYKATLENQKWRKVEELPFNSNDYSTAHPALTMDGKWMYFASDRENGKGQSDLYKVAVNPDGSFGQPINLGDAINTEGRESFPFITKDNELYFSTDGRPGLGGLDIYATKINADGSFTEVQNIGSPANSSLDDFAYYIDTKSRRGFLSSNRAEGMGNDDIYSFLETRRLSLECLQSIFGKVYDKQTQAPLAHANLTLYDGNFKQIGTVQTSADGKYEFKDLKCGSRYRINAGVEDYNTAEVAVDLPMQTGSTQVDFGLEKTRIEVKKGDDLFKVLKLNPIYFDFDKSNIRPDAAAELAKVVEVLRDYPEMKIDVRSHTDSRGNDAYNLSLSDRRAKSTIAWIVDQGISKERVDGKGYGETQLVNECSNGVKCSEAAHQENRRSEFIVLEL